LVEGRVRELTGVSCALPANELEEGCLLACHYQCEATRPKKESRKPSMRSQNERPLTAGEIHYLFPSQLPSAEVDAANVSRLHAQLNCVLETAIHEGMERREASAAVLEWLSSRVRAGGQTGQPS
jgi:hypothetical protein